MEPMRDFDLILLEPFYMFFWFTKMLFGTGIAALTDFVPDEFWQSTEVAYYMFFGKGHLTWEWLLGIRNYIIPTMISGIYSIGERSGILNPHYMIMAPQLVQAVLSLKALLLFFRFSTARMGRRIGKIAYTLYLINWFTTYCFTRTISNQTEMSLNIFCLWHLHRRNHVSFVILLVINFFIRPTSAVFWIPFLPEFLKKFKIRQIFACVVIAAMTAFYAAILDSLAYKRLILTPWEFFKFNFLTRGNEEFGVHPPLWYFYSGLPSILGPLVVLLPFGFCISGNTRKYTLITFYYIGVFSYIGHKEIRFLLPILPLVFIVIASVLWKIYMYCQQKNIFGSEAKRAKIASTISTLFITLNFTVVLIVGLMHQRGFRSVGSYLHHDLPRLTLHDPEVWIIAPCYSMPVHTLMHHRRANFVYYICPPSQFEHLYDTSIKSNLILQTHSFDQQDLREDIQRKYLGRGNPDWIITLGHYGYDVLHTLTQMANTTYIPKMQSIHTYFDVEVRRVVLFQRAV